MTVRVPLDKEGVVLINMSGDKTANSVAVTVTIITHQGWHIVIVTIVTKQWWHVVTVAVVSGTLVGYTNTIRGRLKPVDRLGGLRLACPGLATYRSRWADPWVGIILV
jgi:hypothetical protein